MASIPRDMDRLLMELMGAGSRSPPAFPTDELRAFLSGAGPKNKYLNFDNYNAYLRRGMPRRVGDSITLQRPLDLANISRTNLPNTGEAVERATTRQPAGLRNPKGRFKELIQLLEAEAEKAGYDSIYAEQILNEFLPDVLGSMGYQSAGNDLAGIPSMYRRLGQVGPGEAFLGRGARR